MKAQVRELRSQEKLQSQYQTVINYSSATSDLAAPKSFWKTLVHHKMSPLGSSGTTSWYLPSNTFLMTGQGSMLVGMSQQNVTAEVVVASQVRLRFWIPCSHRSHGIRFQNRSY